MTNQQAVVDQLVQNLAFEVEVVPKNKSIQDSSISQSTPLNVKIKVRKKDEILMQHDVSSIADDTRRAVQKIRLVNSDRTIMTFDVFMEAEFEKKPSRNLRKHIFDMLRPGICLGAVNDDEYPYMPGSSYSANITEPSVANKSDGTLLKQTFTLSKNVHQSYTASTQPGAQKWLFGKCKPGGCLDPPFSEEKYSYKPSIREGPEREGEELLEQEDVGSDIYSKKIPITLHDEEVQNNGRHSSIFDSALFKKKRKSSDKSTITKLPDKTDSIVDIYQRESATNSESTHSNSIITYPPKVRSDPRISDDKTVRNRGPSDDKSKKLFNDHSEPYFIRPNGVNRIKEKKTLDPNDYPKNRSSDATDLRNSHKESFEMPVPLPIPIPVPIPIMSNKRKSEVNATSDNLLITQSDSANVTELDAIPDQKPQDQESQDAINLKDTDMPPRLLRDISATGDTDYKLTELSKIATLMPSDVEQPITRDEIDDQNLHEIKLQPLKEIGGENNIEVTAQPSKKNKTEHLKVPLPAPVPFIFSEANLAAVLDPKMINDNLQRSAMKLTESKQSFEPKTRPPTIKGTRFEDSKEMQQNIDPGNRSGKRASTATPKSQFSNIEAYAIPENYLRIRGVFSEQESDTENLETIAPTIEEVSKRYSKEENITEEPAKQYDITAMDSTATAVATIVTAAAAAATAAVTAAASAAAAIEKSSEIYGMPDTDTQQIKVPQQISLSQLPILKRSISILSEIKISAASVNDKIKRSDSPYKHLDDVGHRDTDKSISILSQGKTSAASVTVKTKESYSPSKDLDNVGYRDTNKSISVLSRGKTTAASVTNNTKRSDSPDMDFDNVGHRDTDKSISILAQGKTSVADKTKRSNSPNKHLDSVGHSDTDCGIYIDENRTSLSSGKTSSASVKEKTKRSDSSDKHLDNVRHRDTNKSISILSQGKTSPVAVTDKTKGSDSPDKDLGSVGYRDTDKSIFILSRGKTPAASVTDNTKRSDSPHKDFDNFGHRDTDKSISILARGKTSAASVTDKTKRNNSPDKHLDNVGHRDSDFGVHIDEKRSSLSSGPTSAESVKNKTKRSDSPDKHLDNIGHRDTNFDVNKDEKRTSLASGPKYETDTRDTKISETSSDKEYLSKTEKPNNDNNIYSYTETQARFTGEGNLNFKVAPIIIENIEPTPNFEPLEEVYRETNFFGEPMNTGHDFNLSGFPFTTQIASRLRKFDEYDGTHATGSRELIVTKSVIYDTEDFIPTTSEKKNAEIIPSYDKRVILPVDIVIPSIQSTSTLKSAKKKDTMSVELGFHSYLNDKNERMLRTFDTANAPKWLQNDSVTVLKSQIRLSSNEIRIPVDSEHDMSIQIKKSNANQRVSNSESGFVNVIDNGRVKKQRSPVHYSDAEMRSSEAITEVRKINILESEQRDDHFIDYFEQELVPLQLIIKNLRDEIDVLAAQQLIFKDKLLFCANKSTIPRLVHSNKACFGCVRK